MEAILENVKAGIEMRKVFLFNLFSCVVALLCIQHTCQQFNGRQEKDRYAMQFLY